MDYVLFSYLTLMVMIVGAIFIGWMIAILGTLGNGSNDTY